MEHEATQELFGGYRHLALLAAVSVVFPAECDVAVGHGQEPMIGDGDAVGVACQIVEHMLRSAEGAFAVDNPLLTKERSQERGKGSSGGQGTEAAREHQLALMKGVLQAVDELATKDAAEYGHGQEERVTRGDPALVIERKATRGDHAMNVRMMLEERVTRVDPVLVIERKATRW